MRVTINYPPPQSPLGPSRAPGDAEEPYHRVGTEPTHTLVGADISQEGDEPLSTNWSASSPTSPAVYEKPTQAGVQAPQQVYLSQYRVTARPSGRQYQT